MSGGCFAQWKIAPGFQLVKASVIDKDFSAVPFSALVPGASLSISYESDHSIHAFSFTYVSESLKTSTQPRYNVNQDYFNADYTWLYKLGAPGTAWTGGAGGALQILYASRNYPGIINNNASFDFAASLAFAGALTHSFNNIWSLSDQLGIPFVSWMIHPPYGEESATSTVSRPGDRQKLAGFSSFLRLKNTLSLNRQLSSKGTLCLAYSWDYYRINDLREVRHATHQMGLIYRLTL